MQIIENTVWADNKNLADAYNDFMYRIDYDLDDWVLFRDGDTLILDSHYGEHLKNIIEANPDVDCFTAITNRIGSPALRYDEYKGDDVLKHKEIAKKLKNKYGTKCTEIRYIENESTLSGFFFLISKRVWSEVGGFKNYKGAKSTMLGVDNMLHKNLEEKGFKTAKMDGMYVYHYYRGGDSSKTEHLV